jgi:succinate dehydrogenase / fumarate reductase flavoprotein subunit
MEVGPTTHYMMGGIKVDGDTQMSTVPGLYAAGECAAGLHGANRLGGNSLSDLLVFGKRAGYYAACFAKKGALGRIADDQINRAASDALAPFERRNGAEGPYQVQQDLQEMMQNLVGIVRTGSEMEQALTELERLAERSRHVTVSGNREYNNGWHTALDLPNLLTVSEAVTRAAIERQESRGAHFREDRPNKDPEFGKVNIIVRKGTASEMQVIRQPVPPMPQELKQIIEEMK